MYNILVVFDSITLLHIAAFRSNQKFSPKEKLILLIIANRTFHVT